MMKQHIHHVVPHLFQSAALVISAMLLGIKVKLWTSVIISYRGILASFVAGGWSVMFPGSAVRLPGNQQTL